MSFGRHNVYQRKIKFMKKTIVSFILIITGLVLTVGRADAQMFSVGVSVRVGPPVIPVYVQPPCPVEGYIWIPGYWAYDDDYGYFWVPGYWAEPPEIGFLWTPGYWACVDGIYAWHAGYWGPHIGFYGGINYGCGYYGTGYVGGGWVGGRFRYNTAVTNVNRTIVRNTYIDRTVIRNTNVTRVSYNGGPGGISARPSAAQSMALRDRHVQATSAQLSQQHNASIDRNQYASINRGRPAHVAVERPTAYRPADTRGNLSRAPMGRANEVGRPQPQTSREVRRPQPAHGEPSRNFGRPQPQPARSMPMRPMGHPQPMRPMGQPMGHPQPMRPAGQPMGHPQPGRPIGHPQQPPHGGGEHHGHG